MMKSLRLLPFGIAAAGWLAGAGETCAQAPRSESPAPASRGTRDLKTLAQDPAFQKRLQAWRALSPEDKEKLRARHQKWTRLPDSERGRMSATLARFKSLTPDQQARLRESLARMSPEQQERLQQAAGRFRNFTRQHEIPLAAFVQWVRRLPRPEIERIRRLPPEERKTELQTVVRRFREHAVERVESEIPGTERESFRKLPFEEKFARARRWFAERNGLGGDANGGADRERKPGRPEASPPPSDAAPRRDAPPEAGPRRRRLVPKE